MILCSDCENLAARFLQYDWVPGTSPYYPQVVSLTATTAHINQKLY